MQLSKNFTLAEFTYSKKAIDNKIDNTPNAIQLDNLKLLVTELLQPLRDKAGKPFVVSSGVRVEKLNTLVGGSSTSQHKEGKAVDFTISGMTVSEACKFIINSGLEFDQLIHEGTWIHLSYNKGKNRRQILTAKFGAKTTYVPGLPD